MAATDFPGLLRSILRGQAGGKTIWQPRIESWYDDREFRGEALPGRFAGASRLELFNALGVSNRLYMFNGCFRRRYGGDIRAGHRKLDALTHENTIVTPVGTVREITRGNTSNGGRMPVKWYVETPGDLRVFLYIAEHTHYSFDREAYDRLMAEWGHLGLPCMFLPRVNIQQLLVELCGVENTFYLLYDEPGLVEAYLAAADRLHLRLIDMVCGTPLEWINFGDNIHSKILSPRLFEKYVLPAYQRRNERLHAAGKFTFAHFDGDVKELLPLFGACGLDGIEAITPLPQGDVTLKEARAAMDGILLVDGIAAILFDETYPLKMLKDQVLECLHLFEGQLVLGISDEMSSTGTLDRIERVRDMVEEFNAKH